MWKNRELLVLCFAVVACVLAFPHAVTSGEKVKLAGLLIDKKDNWITVKADGEKEAVKFVLAKNADKKLQEEFKAVFNASRVQLTYEKNGNERQLVSIKKQVLKAAGTVTGVVVQVHNKFWVEIKPKSSPADAFAPGLNYKDKAFMDKLNSLKPGDVVTIIYFTDFERHRIQMLRIDKRAE